MGIHSSLNRHDGGLPREAEGLLRGLPREGKDLLRRLPREVTCPP